MERTARFGAIPRGAILLLVLGLLVALTTAAGAFRAGSPATAEAPKGPGAFSPAPPMNVARASHTATLLDDGRLLIVGGEGRNRLAIRNVEIRDPSSGVFGRAGALGVARRYHTATLVPGTYGGVLVTGGTETAGGAPELWEPDREAFTPLWPMTEPRSQHTATLVDNGRVLIVGGGDNSSASAELFTGPMIRTFEETDSLDHGRAWHAATLLGDGRVLVTGTHATAELWDPATATFEPAGDLAQTRVEHTATVLQDGRVLVIGGMAGETFGGPALATAELWDPESRTFAEAGAMAEPRAAHTATLLPDGRVLVTGGAFIASAEIWDPETGAFSAAGPMTDARAGHTATLLPGGRVLVAGGYQDRGDDTLVIASTEIWDPLGKSDSSTEADDLAWGPASLEQDWPGPLRSEPEGEARIVSPESATDGGGGDLDFHYTDATAEDDVAAFPWLDIVDMGTESITLAGRPESADPSEQWLAYGLVVDTDLDGIADQRVGMDNAPGGVHRAWRTDLVTGETEAETGPPYGLGTDLPDTYFPGESDGERVFAWFHGAFRNGIPETGQRRFHYYFWASQIEDGRIVATDYAPDTGWLDTHPDAFAAPLAPAAAGSPVDGSEGIWPGPLRPEPTGGGGVVRVEELMSAGGVPREVHRDPQGDETGVGEASVDIVALRADKMRVVIDLAVPPAEGASQVVAYGVVYDTDGDMVPDLSIGIDDPTGDVHRSWRTDLSSGWTVTSTVPWDEQVPKVPDTWFPGEGANESATATFRGAGVPVGRNNRFYAWAAMIVDGRVEAVDYAPDAGWLVEAVD